MTYFGVGSGANLDLANSLAIGGGAGGLGGGALATYETYSDREEIVKKCMEGRGYNILKWQSKKKYLILKEELDIKENK